MSVPAATVAPADEVVDIVVAHFLAAMEGLTPRQRMQQVIGLERVLRDEAQDMPSALSRATMAACLEQARSLLHECAA